jgi:phosphoadenosine phosphosulfate reductase
VITTEPDVLTVLIAGGGFDHQAVDRNLRGQLADIMITGPANEAHRRHGRGSLWGVRAEESHGRRIAQHYQLHGASPHSLIVAIWMA